MNPKQSKTLHIEMVGEELSVYDWKRLQMHSLNPTAAKVFALCDGKNTPAQIAVRLALPEELVWQALDELNKANLLQSQMALPASMSRRQFLKLGSAAAAAAIVSIALPRPAAAQSAVGIIRRTANVDSTDGTVGYEYTSFNEGPITDAQITALNPTQITYSWTGDDVPPAASVGAGIYLAQSNNVRASRQMILPSGTSYSASDSNPAYWTGNRDYNGVDIDVSIPETWFVGVLTVVLG